MCGLHDAFGKEPRAAGSVVSFVAGGGTAMGI
jgi:hypothetical protein